MNQKKKKIRHKNEQAVMRREINYESEYNRYFNTLLSSNKNNITSIFNHGRTREKGMPSHHTYVYCRQASFCSKIFYIWQGERVRGKNKFNLNLMERNS